MNKTAKALSAMRKQVKHTCPICEKAFKALRTARYCSNACRQRAKYQRSKDA